MTVAFIAVLSRPQPSQECYRKGQRLRRNRVSFDAPTQATNDPSLYGVSGLGPREACPRAILNYAKC